MGVQTAWDNIKKLLAAIWLCVPEAKDRTIGGVKISWWNKGLKQDLKRKHKALKGYMRTRGADDYKTCGHQINITALRMRRAKGSLSMN